MSFCSVGSAFLVEQQRVCHGRWALNRESSDLPSVVLDSPAPRGCSEEENIARAQILLIGSGERVESLVSRGKAAMLLIWHIPYRAVFLASQIEFQ